MAVMLFAARKRTINLLPEERLASKASLGPVLVFVLIVSRVVLVAIVIVLLAAELYRLKLDSDLKIAKQDLAQKQQTLVSYVAVESQVLLTQAQIKEVKSLFDQSGKVDGLLGNLVSVVPSGIAFQTLTLTPNQGNVRVFSGDAVAFATFLSALSQASWAGAVTVDNVSALSSGISFTVKFAPQSETKVGSKP